MEQSGGIVRPNDVDVDTPIDIGRSTQALDVADADTVRQVALCRQCLLKALSESARRQSILRQSILVTPELMRDYAVLGVGVPKKANYATVAEISPTHWSAIASRKGMIELYLRALGGEFRTRTRVLFDSLFSEFPRFDLQRALQGRVQEITMRRQFEVVTQSAQALFDELAERPREPRRRAP